MANLPKHPLKRFEPTLRKFQVALPADLARLQQHKINMEKVHVGLNIQIFSKFDTQCRGSMVQLPKLQGWT